MSQSVDGPSFDGKADAALPAEYPSPWKFLLIIVVSMFLVEFCIMLLLDVVAPFESRVVEAAFDGLAEAFLLFPLLYLFLYRPMSLHINRRKLAEHQLRQSQGMLERKVEERTAGLRETTESLQREVGVRRRLSAHIMTAQEEERKRIAMELHDDVGQDLASMKLLLKDICQAGEGGSEDRGEEGSEALEFMDRIINNVQNISRDLAPAVLADLGLEEALHFLAKEISRKYGFRVSGEISNIDHLFSQKTQQNIYRIFQEILTNAGKHAKAREVRISMERQKSGFVFHVRDDGIGFEADEVGRELAAERGMGLLFLEERSRMAGGSVEISSEPGKGTRIDLTVFCDGEGAD